MEPLCVAFPRPLRLICPAVRVILSFTSTDQPDRAYPESMKEIIMIGTILSIIGGVFYGVYSLLDSVVGGGFDAIWQLSSEVF